MGTEGSYINIIKTIHDKPTANIILNSEILKVLPLRSGTMQGYPLLTLLFNIVMEVITMTINEVKKKRKENESKLKKKEDCNFLQMT